MRSAPSSTSPRASVSWKLSSWYRLFPSRFSLPNKKVEWSIVLIFDYISWAPDTGWSPVASPCQTKSWMINCIKLILLHELLIQLFPSRFSLPGKKIEWSMVLNWFYFMSSWYRLFPRRFSLPNKKVEWSIELHWFYFMSSWYRLFPSRFSLPNKKVEWSIV